MYYIPYILPNESYKCIMYNNSGYGLVVEYVLAKDESGVRFSLPAQSNPITSTLIIDKTSNNHKNLSVCDNK